MTLFLMLAGACGGADDPGDGAPDAGAPDAGAPGCGDAEGQGPFAQRACVTASNPGDYYSFGARVVLAGDTLVVSAPGEGSAATGIDGDPQGGSLAESGAVHVFRRAGSSLPQEHYIKASNTVQNAQFGESMALDRDTLVIGAPGESSAATGVNGEQADVSAIQSGAVYVFRRSGTTWQQEAYIKASNTGGGVRDIEGFIQRGDHFGASVALLGDTLVVGARFEDSAATGVDGDQADDSARDSGAVYVFRRAGTTWQQEAYLEPSDTTSGSDFGASVVLTEDTLAVGASAKAPGGVVYVFRRSNSTPWGFFGSSLAVSEGALAVGASAKDASDVAHSGALYLFDAQ